MELKVSLKEGKQVTNKISEAIADLKLGNTQNAILILENVEAWLQVKFVLIETKPEFEGSD